MTGARRIVTALTAGLLTWALAGCTSSGKDVRIMDDNTAHELVQRYADEVLELAGWAEFSTAKITRAGCVGRLGEVSDEMVATYGTFQLLPPVQRHRDIVERVSDGWSAKGYNVEPIREYDYAGAEVSALAVTDDVELHLASGEPPAMALSVSSGCYRRAAAG